MTDGTGDLSSETIIRTGGWHATYARVLLIEHDDHRAVILVDGNGDGAELELEYWHRDEDGLWYGGSSSGHGSLAFLPASQAWNAGDFVAAVGRARPNTDVSVHYGDRVYSRRTSEFGIWGFVHAADSPDAGDLPALVAGSLPTA